MSPGVAIEKSGSVDGSVTVTNVSVPIGEGQMLVQQLRVKEQEIGHYTSHPRGPAHSTYDR